jgi:hypothetical protein
MDEHIRSITHHGKQILMVELANCSARQVEEIVREVPDHVIGKPYGSILALTDFTGASFDEDAVRVMKEGAVFNKPYVRKSAWVGAQYLPDSSRESIVNFSRREFPAFTDRKQALDWLTKD